MGSFRFRDRMQLKEKLKVPQCITYISAGRGEHRTREKSSSIFKNPSWILHKRTIEDKTTRNDLVMKLWWHWMNCVRVKCLVFWIPIYFCSIRQTFRATRRLFRTMEEKIEVCNGHLPSDCVDKTWFPCSRNASDCNVYFHLLPSIHFTLKKFCNGTWITKAILFNFLLKILHTFRFPIHSERTAGNRGIHKRKWPSTATRLYYVEAGTRDETFSIPVLVREFITHTQRGAGEWWSGQSQGLLGGASARFWPHISACRLQPYSFILWQFPTVSDNS